jgi:glycosyltransferase involved in cell wall biosynthesis
MTGDPLRVLQVDTADAGGGAEKVVMGLHGRYLELGIDSWVAVGRKYSGSPRVLEIPNESSRSAWARVLEAQAASLERAGGAQKALSRALLLAAEPRRYERILRGVEDFDYPGSARLLSLPPRRPEILHLHNLHGYYFDVRRLPALAATQPTLITLHDTWLLTGHCAHPFACARWRTGCGGCPDLGMYVPIRRDASASNRRIKRDAVRASKASLATPSRWLMRMVEASGLLGEGAEARVIPNGADTRVFSPGDRQEARALLGLPADRPIVLFAAKNAADNPFKDFATLLKALPHIGREMATPPLFVALGADPEPREDGLPGVLRIPFETDAARLASWYRAADVYVHPTRAESFGLAVAEAMACGAAVVASRVGGVPEIVEDGSSGVLVGEGDADQLCRAVSKLLGDPRRARTLGLAAAARIAERFTLERQVDAYLAFYDALAESRRAGL